MSNKKFDLIVGAGAMVIGMLALAGWLYYMYLILSALQKYIGG